MSFARSLKESCNEVWEACYRHPFVQELGQGVLEKETFMFYLKQDYKYLLEYAKVFAIGVTKAKDETVMKNLSATQKAVLDEMDGHRAYMQRHGIDLAEAEATRSSLFNKAYTANMVNVGFQGDLLELLVTVFPCAWSYYDFAMQLKHDYADKLANNYYRDWIESYAGEDYQASFAWFFDAIDDLAQGKSAVELEALTEIFRNSVEFEYLFWDMSYKQMMSFI